MTREELKAKFPTRPIKAEPLPDCPQCKGVGWYTNRLKYDAPCLCVYMSADDALRLHAVNSMRRVIANLKVVVTRT